MWNKSKNKEMVWDNIYRGYSKPDIVNDYIYERLISILNKYIKPADDIIEVGCGSGYIVSYFQKKGHYSVGLDLYEKPLEIAKKVFGVKNLIRGNIFNLPFSNHSFDVVWNEGVLEHFKFNKSVEAAREMARISKNYVIIDVPNRNSLFVVSKIIKKIIGIWPYGYEESYSEKRLKKLMELAGLEVIGTHGIYLAPPMSVWRGWKSILSLLVLTIPLPEWALKRLFHKIGIIEEEHGNLAKFFGFHLVMVGKVVLE